MVPCGIWTCGMSAPPSELGADEHGPGARMARHGPDQWCGIDEGDSLGDAPLAQRDAVARAHYDLAPADGAHHVDLDVHDVAGGGPPAHGAAGVGHDGEQRLDEAPAKGV